MIATIIKPFTRSELTFNVVNTATIATLRQLIREAVDTTERLTLTFNGTLLEDCRNLKYYNINGPADHVNLVIGSLFK